MCIRDRARDSIGHKKDSPIPKGVHWDLHRGPASYRPFNENRFHYNWHWFWDTGTGDLGNQGSHHMDVTRWGMKKRVHPISVHCAGGYFAFDSDQERPNTQHMTFEYEDGTIMQFEVRGAYTNPEVGVTQGNLFFGSKGWMAVDNFDWSTFFGRKNEPGPSLTRDELRSGKVKLPEPLKKSQNDNFIDCMRSRKWQDLNCDIWDGHMSAALCHLGNIAYLTGRKLTFNPHSEKFVNDDDANTYLTRQYRYPFVVPDKV